MTRIDVIVPVRDAASQLSGCLEALGEQTVQPGRINVVVGPSNDGTLALAHAAQARNRRIVVLENLPGDRGSALNVGLGATDSETVAVAMVDAQSRLAPDYLERSAAVLEESGAEVVGGPMHAVGMGVIGYAIAAALSSRIGVGDSSFHFEGRARDVESVYLGVYRRSVFDAVGLYDPTLLRTEDDDMNARIREAGGRIRLDPSIRSTYFGRQSLGGLFRQYQSYGYWKVAFAAKHRGAIRLRHLIPAGFIAALVGTGLVSIVAWPPAVALLVFGYASLLGVVGLLATNLPVVSRLAFPAAVATMHLGYGLGTWTAVLTGRWRR